MDGGRRRGRSKHSVAGSDFRAGDRPAPRPGTGTRKEAGCVPCDPETSTRLLGKAKDQEQEAQGRARAGGKAALCHAPGPSSRDAKPLGKMLCDQLPVQDSCV